MAKVKKLTNNNDKFTVELMFDNKDAAHSFVAYWLDGGGDGGGNIDWNTDYKESDDWTVDVPKMLRIKGTGYPIEWENDQKIIVTPEIEKQRLDAVMKKYGIE